MGARCGVEPLRAVALFKHVCMRRAVEWWCCAVQVDKRPLLSGNAVNAHQGMLLSVQPSQWVLVGLAQLA
jgi:hypothetical protein